MSAPELSDLVASNPSWYHTIELPGGVVTPGWFDLRPIIAKLPWPDVAGKRCLDVGTYDGCLAFELERRGAAEVVAVDIASHEDWDWPADARVQGPARLAEMAGEKGRGFEIARDALGSKVDRRFVNIYDLTPEELGTFDVVVVGALLLHLRDPIRAMEAVRSVCGGHLLSWDQVDLTLSAVFRRRPVAQLHGSGEGVQWWTPNIAGYHRMLFSAGFQIEAKAGPWSLPFGTAHPPTRWRKRDLLLQRVMTGGTGLTSAAVRATPRF